MRLHHISRARLLNGIQAVSLRDSDRSFGDKPRTSRNPMLDKDLACKTFNTPLSPTW